ncbi:COX15/CtaA family protein [Flavobacteriaceae bacterium F89]|uniref:COX15/CtaA family protein n=1 Tax=Cerina litoralis TaxID=2874477 RepID=A0AAE3JUJ2_9FLAO|nr:COX15/CtaA family protein [Cerina litoralis]MCG2462452.1 COX15/CtaA family protein [Cerina litoralis]
MHNHFRSIAKVALVTVYLVIIAGTVVRMTGSGMGCPDWPKCFGHYIPPTDISELQWQEHKTFKKGEVIIRNESLWVATRSFVTSSNYDPENWNPYTKHDYAVFNAAHTWTEFINRLFGALAGLATLFMAIASITYWKKMKLITILSWLVVFCMGFQAWLGAVVVYSVLEPVKITIHMVMALVIVAMILYLIFRTKSPVKKRPYNKRTTQLLWLALFITLIQVILGTEVRQFVDEQVKLVGENAQNLWLQKPYLQFYIHRSFSILVVLLNLYIAYKIYKLGLGYDKINWVMFLILLAVLSGMAMYYLDFPYGTQPIHLVIASLLFGVQFYLVLEGTSSITNPKDFREKPRLV